MSLARLGRLAAENLGRDRAGALLSAGGVAVGVGALCFFVALGMGISDVIRTRIFPVDARSLEVVPGKLSLGSLLGGGQLDESALQRLSGLPGVAAAYPKMALRVPAVTRYDGNFFGREIHMGLEVIGSGMPPELVGSDARLSFEDQGETAAIPVVVNRRLLELYNKVFAPQRGLPRLTDSMLTGFQFPVELGRSYVAGKTLPNAQETSLVLAGFSDRATLGGVSMPLAAVRRINARFGADAATYSSVLLRAASAEEMPALAAAVRRMGFELDETERNRALQIGAAVELVTLALGLLAGLITLLAAVNTMQAFYASVRERRREIGVLRAVGATRGDVAGVLLAEAAATGLAGGVTGILLARGAALLLDRLSRTHLPDFPFKPQTFFHFDARQVVLGLFVALAAALFGAFLPARAAARLDPARALTET